jgi:hypothetical protein
LIHKEPMPPGSREPGITAGQRLARLLACE